MEFRFDTRVCAESILKRCPGVDPDSCECTRNVTLGEEDWNEQKFSCADFNGGPSDDFGTYYITATPEKDETVIYFEGLVTSGDALNNTFNATDPDLDRVEANMYLRVFEYADGVVGSLVQEVLFHSSCSQQLYLLDIFGSFQLIEFESTGQGVIGFGLNPEVSFSIDLDVIGDVLDLTFLSVVVLSNSNLIPPQVFEPNVTGVSIPPPFESSSEITLIVGEDFDVITTIGGELNGVVCFDVSQTTINCGATVEP